MSNRSEAITARESGGVVGELESREVAGRRQRRCDDSSTHCCSVLAPIVAFDGEAGGVGES